MGGLVTCSVETFAEDQDETTSEKLFAEGRSAKGRNVNASLARSTLPLHLSLPQYAGSPEVLKEGIKDSSFESWKTTLNNVPEPQTESQTRPSSSPSVSFQSSPPSTHQRTNHISSTSIPPPQFPEPTTFPAPPPPPPADFLDFLGGGGGRVTRVF